MRVCARARVKLYKQVMPEVTRNCNVVDVNTSGLMMINFGQTKSYFLDT